MGNLVFQATLGGQVNLVGPNTASTFNLNVPAVSATLATTAANTFTAVQTLTAGSASAPALTTTGDTNTGIFFPAADTVGVTTGGSERARVDSSGNFGLGVTPSAWSGGPANEIRGLSLWANATNGGYSVQNAFYNGSNWIYKTTSQASYYLQGTGIHSWHTAASGTAGNAITFTQAMTLDASGNLGVGTSSPQLARAHLTTASTYTLNLQNDASNQSGIIFSRNGNGGASSTAIVGNGETTGYLYFLTGGSERARIDSSGNLLVGTTNSSDIAGVGVKVRQVSSQTQVSRVCSSFLNTYVLYNTAAGAYRFYVSEAGQIYATSTSITAISDQALKENIRDLETGLTEVMALQPRRFDWKNGDATNVAGFIAQEVEQVLPELVQDYVYSKDEEGNDITKKSLKMGDMLPTLVKAIQEQQAIIETLTARIEALEA